MTDNQQFDPEHTLVTGPAAGSGARERRPGDIVGGTYKIKSVIGRGGMGVVYCAEHLTIKREYALKALAPDRIDESNWLRFLAEGKAIARLDHPNIVKVYDMGTDGHDCLYYVMDLLHGVSLAEVIHRRGIVEMRQALEIFIQLCAGLGYAHKLGLIHRDIKPSNIILPAAVPGKAEPLVKIIDYGLVKPIDEGSQMVQSQTATGLVCGSPFYMSPEQCLGGKIDERSDIYSLGCTLFECLTGEPPFTGINGLETALKHQTEAIPKLSDFRPDKKYPENLEQVVNRMLQKKAASRYQSMEQVAQDLVRVKEGKDVSRESRFLEGPLFDIDDSIEEELEAPDRKRSLPLAWIYSLAAVVTIFAVWATVSHFAARDQSQAASKALIGKSSRPGIIIGRQETAEIKHAREVFANCPQISNGIVDRGGYRERIFHFPEVPLGFISCGNRRSFTRLAQGEVSVPAVELVILQLPLKEGQYARMFPDILTKIGPEDVHSLEVRDPQTRLDDDDTISSEVSVQLVKAISKWRALRMIDFYHCKVGKDSLLALNDIASPITELRMRDSPADGNVLAQVIWLKNLSALDAKGIDHIDAVLHALSGGRSLRSLTIDATVPSKAGLKFLAACPNLQMLSLEEAEIDDQKLEAVCGIASLEGLNLKRCPLDAKALSQFSKLKKLKSLNLGFVPITEADVDNLRRSLPSCKIEYQSIGSVSPGQLLGGK